jgi:hypothetical protein
LGSSGGLDEIVESVPARKLPGYWPASLNKWSTKAVRDAFYSSPLLPRLLNPEQIKRSISDGVTQGLLGYAVKDSSGRLKLHQLKESLFEGDVELTDDVFILKPEEAQKLREPPRLHQLSLQHTQVQLKSGQQVSLRSAATDQYGQPIAAPAVTWESTGGTITSDGVFTAGSTPGIFLVRAESGGREAIVEVRISATDEPVLPPPQGKSTIRWRGSIPPQKWMNFYTKVLSKYATLPDLKLEVSFEAKIDREQADTKSTETKSALRELGLDDNVIS